MMKQQKRFRVRTKQEPYLWLHALDPLDVGRAFAVRSEWRVTYHGATIFPSNMYADTVAQHSPYVWGEGGEQRFTHPYHVERAPE
jgi:hypothetical protein